MGIFKIQKIKLMRMTQKFMSANEKNSIYFYGHHGGENYSIKLINYLP